MPSLPRVTEAIRFADEAHAAQVRKGTQIPYLAHLLAVAAITLELGGTETETVAAVLHDAAEDQGGETMLAEIESRFGPEVRAIVEANSDALEHPKPAWQPRKEAYIAGIAEKSESACLVSLADKLHNAQSLLEDQLTLGDAHWSRFTGTKEMTLWYYRSLAEAFAARPEPRLQRPAERLQAIVDALARA